MTKMQQIQQSPKKVCAIHDMSSVGRCSLSVIAPLMSAMGMQVCPVPTAVLSTHTGGFGQVVKSDLTDFMRDTLSHFKSLQLDFDCIYSGYLSCESQADICLDYFKTYNSAFIVVDPVMGDHGKPYVMINNQMQERMQELVAAADMITPNLTEVCMLLNQKYTEPLTRHEVKQMLVKLAMKGPAYIIITGIPTVGNVISNFGYDKNNDHFWEIVCDYVPASYPGTGDAFCAVATAALLSNDSLPLAIERSTKFIEFAINITYSYQSDPRHGIMFEKAMPWLFQQQSLKNYHSF